MQFLTRISALALTIALAAPGHAQDAAPATGQGGAGGEALLLCRLFPEEAPGEASSDFASALADLFHKGGDAIVLTDADGRIETANESFLNLVDVAVARDVFEHVR